VCQVERRLPVRVDNQFVIFENFGFLAGLLHRARRFSPLAGPIMARL
jgi:hypothetical protein